MLEITTSTDTSSITLTDRAGQRIAFLATRDNAPENSLRITVEGGGCSGFKYHYAFGFHQVAEDDIVLENQGGRVLIDAISLPFMKGCIIDYVETLGSAEFQIINPGASARCGCGNSFAM